MDFTPPRSRLSLGARFENIVKGTITKQKSEAGKQKKPEERELKKDILRKPKKQDQGEEIVQLLQTNHHPSRSYNPLPAIQDEIQMPPVSSEAQFGQSAHVLATLQEDKQKTLGLTDELCEACQGLNFKDFFNTGVWDLEVLCRVGNPTPNASCPLCAFFAVMANPLEEWWWKNEGDEEFEYYCLVALNAARYFTVGNHGFPQLYNNRNLLAVVPNHISKVAISVNARYLKFIVPTSHPIESAQELYAGRRLFPTCVDFGVLREWIGSCQDHHGRLCNNYERISFGGFRVIDCHSRRIVSAPENCTYGALSYLWGKASHPQHHYADQKLPSKCAKVIEDSICVMKELGFQYLWIDRYCINQEESLEKRIQIANMDSIYMNAEVTIVDAASSDSSFGLPGVRSTPRIPQPYIQLPDVMLVPLENPVDVVINSPWMTRGWTYQEGLLSRRRLIFTNKQVYFQCLGSHLFESLAIPFELFRTTANISDVNRFLNWYTVFPTTSPVKYCSEFLQRVNEYNKRSLSFEADRLSAFSGVLKRFESRPSPIRNFWGIPIFPLSLILDRSGHDNTCEPDSEERTSADHALTSGLAWVMAHGEVPVIRRERFPSWSWVGWAGGMELKLPGVIAEDDQVRSLIQVPAVRIATETKKGRIIDWNVPYTRLPDLSDCTYYLYLEAWVGTLSLHKGRIWQVTKPGLNYGKDPNIYISRSIDGEDYTAVVVLLGYQHRQWRPPSPPVRGQKPLPTPPKIVQARFLIIESVLPHEEIHSPVLHSWLDGAQHIRRAAAECYTRIGMATLDLEWDYRTPKAPCEFDRRLMERSADKASIGNLELVKTRLRLE